MPVANDLPGLIGLPQGSTAVKLSSRRASCSGQSELEIVRGSSPKDPDVVATELGF